VGRSRTGPGPGPTGSAAGKGAADGEREEENTARGGGGGGGERWWSPEYGSIAAGRWWRAGGESGTGFGGDDGVWRTTGRGGLALALALALAWSGARRVRFWWSRSRGRK